MTEPLLTATEPVVIEWTSPRWVSMVDEAVIERFWSKVNKDGPVSAIVGTPCWLWTAGLRGGGSRGYGVFAVSKKNLVGPHSFSYWLRNGIYHTGLDHRCHVRLCANHDHLRLLTNKQNNENRGGPNKNSSSGIRGVYWYPKRRRWVAKLMHHGREYWAGQYLTREEAEFAIVAKRNELFTHNDLDRMQDV